MAFSCRERGGREGRERMRRYGELYVYKCYKYLIYYYIYTYVFTYKYF